MMQQKNRRGRMMERAAFTVQKRDVDGHTSTSSCLTNKYSDCKCDVDSSKCNDSSTKSSSLAVKWSKAAIRKTKRRFHNKTKPRFERFVLRKKTKKSSREILSDVFKSTTMPEGEYDAVNKPVIVLTPVLEVLLHDAVLTLSCLMSIALAFTAYYWNSIVANLVPPILVLIWLTCTFFSGVEVGLSWEQRRIAFDEAEDDSTDCSQRLMDDSSCTFHPTVGYTIITSLLRLFRPTQVIYPASGQIETTSDQFVSRQGYKGSKVGAKSCVWSTLAQDRAHRMPWEVGEKISVAKPLMSRLMSNPNFQRSDISLGGNDSSSVETVVDTLCNLRGVDCFLTDAAEDRMLSHPFLVQQGVRDVPTVAINVKYTWANIMIYFELPEWFTGFNNIEESKDDPTDVIAFKRFLNGDDEFRNKYTRLIPFVEEGPLPARICIPPSKEVVVPLDYFGATWIEYDRDTTAAGKELSSCLEVELDFISKSSHRVACSMLRRYFPTMSVQTAIVIEIPSNNGPDLSACVGIFHLNHIHPDSCPLLPDRLSEECTGDSGDVDVRRASLMHADIRRASIIAQLSPAELAALADAYDE